MKECNRKLVFVIVLFIIGHTRNRAQSTPEESGKPVSGQTTAKIFFENATGNLVHLLNRWQTGNRKPRSCILPAEWKAMSLDPNRKDLRRDHACRRLQIEDKENHWSLERQQDRCGTLDPFQACPDGRRAHACSSRRSRGSYVSLSWVRTPKEGPGYNWPAIPFRRREMIGKRKWGWNPNLKFSHFTEVPKATQEKIKGNLQFFLWQEGTVDENRRLPSTLAGLITKTPHCRRIAVSSRLEMTPGNEM